MSARPGIDAPKFTRPVSKYSSKFVPTSTGTPATLARPALSGVAFLDSLADADASIPSTLPSYSQGESRERKTVKHEDPPASHTSYLQARAEQRGGDVFDKIAGFLRASSRRTCGIGLAFVLTILLALVVIDIAYTDLDEVAQVEGIGHSSGTETLAAMQASDMSSLANGGDEDQVSPLDDKAGKGGKSGKKGKKNKGGGNDTPASVAPSEGEEQPDGGSEQPNVEGDAPLHTSWGMEEGSSQEGQPVDDPELVSGRQAEEEQSPIEVAEREEVESREQEAAEAREREEREARERDEREAREREEREAQEREQQEREQQVREQREREETEAAEAREREAAEAREREAAEAREREREAAEAANRAREEEQQRLLAAAVAAKQEAFPVYEGEVQLAGYVPQRCRRRSVMEDRRRRLLAVPPKGPKPRGIGSGGPAPKGPSRNWEAHAASWDRVMGTSNDKPAPTVVKPETSPTMRGSAREDRTGLKRPIGVAKSGVEGFRLPPLGSPGNRPDVLTGPVVMAMGPSGAPRRPSSPQGELLPDKVFYSPSANTDVVKHVLGLLKRPRVACSDVGLACGEQGKKFGLVLSPGVFGSCAIVGLGPNLKGKARGKEIDGHDTVIRMGLAPLKGFTMDVGHKMSIVYMRRHSSPHSDIYDSTLRSETFDVKVFWRSDPPRFGNSQLFGGTGYGRNDDGAVGLMEDVALGKMTRRPFLRSLALSNTTADKELYRLLEKYVTHRDNAIVEYGPSHGFHVVNTVLASGLCKTVDLYGFTESMRGHYFPDGVLRQGYAAGDGIVPGLEYFVYRLMMANNLVCLYD